MDVKELRIGNSVLSPFKKIEYVTKIGYTKIWTNRGCYFISEIEPIELTEEWLLKFGFLSNPYDDVYELGSFHVHCDKTTGVLRLWCEINDRIVDLKTVHRLQNLYFSIYEEELTIKN